MTENTPNPTDFDSLRDTLSGWLLEEGYQLREAQAQDAAWMLVAEDGAARRFMVGQKPGRPDVVVIQGTVAVAENHVAALDSMDAAERENLLYELRFRLLGLGLDFSGVSHPLRQVILSEHLYWDDVGRNEFFRTLRRVRHGIVGTVWTLAHQLATASAGGGSGDPASPPMEVN